jgi:hypothetical protein
LPIPRVIGATWATTAPSEDGQAEAPALCTFTVRTQGWLPVRPRAALYA